MQSATLKRLALVASWQKLTLRTHFCIILIHPQDYKLLGIFWRGCYNYDRSMPMGCSSSCKTFETFSTAIQWIAQKKFHNRNRMSENPVPDANLRVNPLFAVNFQLISLFTVSWSQKTGFYRSWVHSQGLTNESSCQIIISRKDKALRTKKNQRPSSNLFSWK